VRQAPTHINPRRQALGPEYNPWYWNPNRIGAVKAPSWYMERVAREFGEDIDIVRNPISERWQVFSRFPKMQHPVCCGWRLLFVHKDVDGSYLPLDERLLMRILATDMTKQGGAKAYFDRIQNEQIRDRERAEKQALQDTIDIATETGWDHSRISTAGRGNKFTRFHS
jgi:hypothetical protein